LNGLFLTDDLSNPTRHQLVSEISLEPGQHFLFWADASVEQGVDHLDFKLSADGEGIYLFAPDGESLITSCEFIRQVEDVSLARKIDGSNEWVFSAVPTPGAANADPQTQTL